MESLAPIPTPPSQLWDRWNRPIIHGAFFVLICSLGAWVWHGVMRPSHFQGQAEVVQVLVTTPDAGLLTNIWVDLHQDVRAGDVLAELITTDPRTVNSRMSFLRSRMQLLELEVDPKLMRQRAALEYERLVVEAAQNKVSLALADINYQKAVNDLERNRVLHDDLIISDELFDFYAKAKEAMEGQVLQLSNVVHYTEGAVERLKYLQEAAVPDDQNDPVRRALDMEENRRRVFEDKVKPLPLLSPIDGVITMVHHIAQENVVAGDPILTVTASKANRIIGYLPLNFPTKPKVGMAVEIRTRAFRRKIGEGRVLGFGPHLEATTNVFNRILIPPMGRSISVSLPEGLEISPGEPVDMRLVD